MDTAEPFAETLKPRGERSLVGRWFSTITVFARVAGHAFDTRDGFRGSSAAPQGRAEHTHWVWVSQEWTSSFNILKMLAKCIMNQGAGTADFARGRRHFRDILHPRPVTWPRLCAGSSGGNLACGDSTSRQRDGGADQARRWRNQGDKK